LNRVLAHPSTDGPSAIDRDSSKTLFLSNRDSEGRKESSSQQAAVPNSYELGLVDSSAGRRVERHLSQFTCDYKHAAGGNKQQTLYKDEVACFYWSIGRLFFYEY